jgi:hypothetical protein
MRRFAVMLVVEFDEEAYVKRWSTDYKGKIREEYYQGEFKEKAENYIQGVLCQDGDDLDAHGNPYELHLINDDITDETSFKIIKVDEV